MSDVPRPHRGRTLWLASLGVLAIFSFLASSLQVERVVTGACQFDPSLRWSLTELRAGSFESRTEDLISGEILDYQLYQFDAAAFLGLEIPAGGGGDVERGQIVAKLQSSRLELDIAERRTALAEARSELSRLESGEKPEEVAAARIAARRARTALDAFLPQFERQRGLNEEGIVSQEMWEEALARKDLLELDLLLADANIDVLTSDARPERIAGARATRSAVAAELAMIEGMLSATEIRAPLAGRLRSGGELSLLSIAKLDTMIVRILIPQQRAGVLQVGQTFRTYVPGVAENIAEGRLVRIDRRAGSTMAGPFIVAYGLVPNTDETLAEGMQGRARLRCGNDTLLGRLWRDIAQSFKREMWPL